MARAVDFHSTEDLLADLDLLARGPVRTTGLWSFAQILEHLSEGMLWAMNQPVPSYSSETPLMDPSLGRKFFERMVRKWKMPANVQNPRAPQEREEKDYQAVLARTRELVAELATYGGPHPAHAFFGELTSDEWRTWNFLHFANHLQYVEPAGPS